MKKTLQISGMLVALTLLASCVSYGPKLPADMTAVEAGGKSLLADSQGLSLYIFDLDLPEISNCYQDCATNWPPVLVSEGAVATGDFTIIPRKDGASQWAYKGMPLYRFIKDKKSGDMTGDGIRNVWHLVILNGSDGKKSEGSKSTY